MSDILVEISVIICAYSLDRWTELEQAIKSLRNQTVQPYEIILVIDHNTDLHARAREAFPGVKVIENQESRGLSGARNTGVAHCQAPIIAFMDEDAVAASDWIENLLSGYQDMQVIGVGGAVIPAWESSPPDWFPEEFNWVVGCSYKGLPLTPSPVRNPIGCNMSFRKKVILSVGGFRNEIGRISAIPVGCEETELSIRIKQLYPSSKILYQPEAIVYHKVPTWRAVWSYFTRRCYSEGLSKALVTHYVGSNDGLSSERSYVTSTLPQAVIHNLDQAIFHGNSHGFARAAAITAGVLLTTTGYVVGGSRHGNRKVSHEVEKKDIPMQGNSFVKKGIIPEKKVIKQKR